MSIQKTADSAAPITSTSTPAGNASAGMAAEKSRAVLDAITPETEIRLRDLPTKRERLHAVADAIENAYISKKLNIGFNMFSFEPYSIKYGNVDQTQHNCGTTACIAGWTSLIDDPSITRRSERDIEDRAANILMLTDKERLRLFYANSAHRSRSNITDKHAVAVLRDFADNGTVRWERFDDEGKQRKMK